MENLVFLAACFGAGIVLRLSGRLPESAPAALNAFVIHLSLPALILLYVHAMPFDAAMLYPVLAPWLLFAIGFVFFSTLQRISGWSPATTGGLILSGSLANTSFVGLPMIEAFYGATFLGVGILMDQLGTYLVLSTLGILIAAYSAQAAGGVNARDLLAKIASFPPLTALLLALALKPLAMPALAEDMLARLGATLAPLALVSVGYQLRLGDIRGRVEPLAWGLAFKLVLGPMLVALVLVKGLGASGPVAQVTVFEIAMASQIGGRSWQSRTSSRRSSSR